MIWQEFFRQKNEFKTKISQKFLLLPVSSQRKLRATPPTRVSGLSTFFRTEKRFTAQATKLIFFTTFDLFLISKKTESREDEKRDYNVALLYVGDPNSSKF